MRLSIPALLLLLAIHPTVATDASSSCTGAAAAGPCPDTSAAQAGAEPTATTSAGQDGQAPPPRAPRGSADVHLKPTPLPAPPDAEHIPTAAMLPLPPFEEETLTASKPLLQEDVAEAAQRAAQGPPPGQDTGAEAPSPPPAPSFDASMLYEGLPWDFCGPRGGGTGIGGPRLETQDQELPVDVDADRADYDRNQDVITLDGDIVIVQGDQRMRADHSVYDRTSGDVTATGRLYVEQPGLRLIAGSGQYNLETKEGSVRDVTYRLSGDANLRGTAEEAALLPGRKTEYHDVTYTTCPRGRSDWSLKASDLLLDHTEGLGTAHHARLRIGDIPVFYTPWLQFPIDDRRRSGFLIPTVGSSDRNGNDITIPYYWNIAPNMDATFYPHYMSARGLALGAELRHLSLLQTMEVYGEVLPHDAKAPELGTRGALRIEQSGRLGHGWTTAINFNAVSDDQYLTDFGNTLDVTSLRNIPRVGDLKYSGELVDLLLRVQDFQTVDPDLPERSRPYAQYPHLELTVDPTEWHGLDWSLDARYDYFVHDVKVDGNRLVLLPAVRLPLRRSYGYLLPRARLYYIGYGLQDEEEGVPSRQSHLIPSLDIDGKLIFERQASWLGRDALQTLEPRLYYVYIPYEDQSDAPLFDTTVVDFSYASLFRPNRFTGYDRIGDENRLTVGVTSRTLDGSSGSELFRLSIGQIFYFEDRRVQLQGTTPDVDRRSSIAGEIAATISKDWTARASLQWNTSAVDTPWERRVLQLRYDPTDARVLNLAYRYNLGSTPALSYEDTDISFRMPITDNFQVVGRWLYSVLNNDTVEAFAGIEYGRCCWRIRVLGRQLKLAGQEEASTSVMLQLELAGLGAIGDSIDTFLERGIYGYDSIH